MKRWLLSFIIFVLVFGSILVYDHREASCFNSPTCVMNKAGLDKESLLVVYRDPDGWSVITYKNKTLREVQITLKKGFPMSKTVVNEWTVETEINYSPLVFSIHQISRFPQKGQFLTVKVNGTVTVLKGEELEHVLTAPPKLEGILEKCSNCTLIFGDKSNRPGVDSNPLIGGYLVFPTKVKCGYSTWVMVVKNDSSASMIAVYPLWHLKGHHKLEKQTPIIENIPPLSLILNRTCDGREILINASGVIINPFPSKLLEEAEGVCPRVDKITIYPNGTIEILKYQKICVER